MSGIKSKVKEVIQKNQDGKLLEIQLKEGKSIKQSKDHEEILKFLEEKLKSKYPQLKVYSFGSRLTGIGTSESDLDVFIDLDGEMYYDLNHQTYTESHRSKVQSAIHEIQEILNKDVNSDLQVIFTLLQARFPLIRCLYKNSFEVDLTFNNASGFENTKFINYIFQIQPMSMKLSLFLKLLFKELNYVTLYSNYILTILVLFYFQENNWLPSIARIQEGLAPIRISYWQVNFNYLTLDQLGIPQCQEDLLSLTVKFFEYFKKFDYKNNIVCTYLGKPLSRRIFEDPVEQPANINEIYREFLEKPENTKQNFAFDYKSPIVVQSPFVFTSNMTKTMTEEDLQKFLDICEVSCEEISNIKLSPC